MKKWLLSVGLLFLLMGCSGQNDNSMELKMLEVEILTEPDVINSNEEVDINAYVTYGEEEVNDAYDMKFEVWKHGAENREMIEGESLGNGMYSIKKTFTEEGTYYVVAHVTARDMHNMPKKELTVGTPSKAADEEAEQSTMD